MSNTNEPSKRVILDFTGAFQTLKNRGIKYNKSMAAANHNVSTQNIYNWQKEVPKAVKFIFDLCNETGLTFEEIVKEV